MASSGLSIRDWFPNTGWEEWYQKIIESLWTGISVAGEVILRGCLAQGKWPPTKKSQPVGQLNSTSLPSIGTLEFEGGLFTMDNESTKPEPITVCHFIVRPMVSRYEWRITHEQVLFQALGLPLWGRAVGTAIPENTQLLNFTSQYPCSNTIRPTALKLPWPLTLQY